MAIQFGRKNGVLKTVEGSFIIHGNEITVECSGITRTTESGTGNKTKSNTGCEIPRELSLVPGDPIHENNVAVEFCWSYPSAEAAY